VTLIDSLSIFMGTCCPSTRQYPCTVGMLTWSNQIAHRNHCTCVQFGPSARPRRRPHIRMDFSPLLIFLLLTLFKAIDLMTRRLVAAGQRPVTVGTWFSLGHSTYKLFFRHISHLFESCCTNYKSQHRNHHLHRCRRHRLRRLPEIWRLLPRWRHYRLFRLVRFPACPGISECIYPVTPNPTDAEITCGASRRAQRL